MDCVLSANLKQDPAHQAMRLAGLDDSVGATTIIKTVSKITILMCVLILKFKHTIKKII